MAPIVLNTLGSDAIALGKAIRKLYDSFYAGAPLQQIKSDVTEG